MLVPLADIDGLSRSLLPFPVAVKIESPDIAHKTEAGAVRLGITDPAGLKQAAREVASAAQSYRPSTRIDGVLVQEMARGVEVIVGAVNDPHFGPVVAFGLDGVFTELLKGMTYRFALFDVETVREMTAEIKAAPLLRGYPGQPKLDIEALADALSRLSYLIAEIDVNPLFVRPAGEGVVAADALMVTMPP